MTRSQSFATPLDLDNPVDLCQQTLEERVGIGIGSFNGSHLIGTEIAMLDVGPVVRGVDDRQAEQGGDRLAAINAGQQIERHIRAADSADGRSGKAAAQFRPHRHHGFAPIIDVVVPTFAEINAQRTAIPGRRESDLGPKKRLAAGRRAACGGRRWCNVADQWRHGSILPRCPVRRRVKIT